MIACYNTIFLQTNEDEKEISKDMEKYMDMQNERYNELMLLMENDSVPNFEPFECPICLVPYNPHEGLILKNCLHTFCKYIIAVKPFNNYFFFFESFPFFSFLNFSSFLQYYDKIIIDFFQNVHCKYRFIF